MVGHAFDRLRDGYGVLLDVVLPVPCPGSRLRRLHLCARGAPLHVLGQGTGAGRGSGRRVPPGDIGAGRDARLHRRSYGQGLRDRPGAARVPGDVRGRVPVERFWRLSAEELARPGANVARDPARGVRCAVADPGIEALRRAAAGVAEAPATTMSSWSSRAPARPRKWRAMPDNWSALPSPAASSCSPTPISKSTCRRSGSRSIASGWPISGSISPKSAGSSGSCSPATTSIASRWMGAPTR